MKKQISDIAKEIRIFVQVTSSIGDKMNAEMLEKRIFEEIENISGQRREKAFSAGAILGIGLGISLSIIIYLQYHL